VAFGGAINYVSSKPSNAFEGRISGDFGNYGQAEVTGSVSGPLIKDILAVRVNGSYLHHGGFYRNEISGDKVGNVESYGGALSARFTPNSDLTFDARVAYSEDRAGPAAQYYIGGGNNGTVLQPLTPEAKPLIDAGVFPAQIRQPLSREMRPVSPIQLSVDPLTGEDFFGSEMKSLNTSLLIEWNLGNNIKFNSWTGYNRVRSNFSVDTDFWGLPDAPVSFPTPGGIAEPLANSFTSAGLITTKQVNQELRLSDLTSSGFRWAAGFLYWTEDYDTDAKSVINVIVGPPGQASAALNARLARPQVSQPTFRHTTHYSLYGMVEVDLAQGLTASAEGRYSWESFDYQWFAGGTAAVSVFGPANGNIAPGVRFNASADESFFAPRFSLNYKVDEDVLLYATASKGVKPGGFSTVSAPAIQNARYTQETLWNYEIGMKSQLFDKRLTLNGSGFYMDYQDKQFSTLIPDNTSPNGVTSVTRNGANSRVIGLELDAILAVTRSLTLSAGYTLLASKYTDFTLFSDSAVTVALAGTCTPTTVNGRRGCNITADGFQLERLSKHSLRGQVGYRTPVSETVDLFTNFDVFYQSRRYLNTTELEFVPAYWDSSLQIGVETDRWSALAYATNLFDNLTPRGATSFGDFHPFGAAGFVLNAAPRRQVGARVSYKF
jgi:outer membrane receptor protein involved in Fe transport